MDESKVLRKILALVQKQQDILKKIAQSADMGGHQAASNSEIESYLKSAWQTAGANSGITQMSSPSVSFTPGAGVGDNSSDMINVASTYTVSGNIPVQFREKFNHNFYNQIKSQKPELEGRVHAIYSNV